MSNSVRVRIKSDDRTGSIDVNDAENPRVERVVVRIDGDKNKAEVHDKNNLIPLKEKK